MKFQNPISELAVVKRRDTIQHPFLEDLHKWSSSLRFYEFGTQLGKNTLVRIPPTLDLLEYETNLRDYDHVLGVFEIGERQLSEKFTQAIIKDMGIIGYEIEDIGMTFPSSFTNTEISTDSQSDNLPKFLYVREKRLNARTEQSEMSQGMFRALSLFIQINYSLLASSPSCILIDDIGEGLDHQRSKAIISLLIEKAKTDIVQLIMTTNDQFIMNGVPLDYWLAIEQKPGLSKLHNYFNEKEKFEQFKFIGLNNFDFFASGFYLNGFEEE
jgi:hypothetical protein